MLAVGRSWGCRACRTGWFRVRRVVWVVPCQQGAAGRLWGVPVGGRGRVVPGGGSCLLVWPHSLGVMADIFEQVAPSATVVADSIAPDGTRVVTLVERHHRFILAEVNTHSSARSGSSSRARPVGRTLPRALTEIAMPVGLAANQPGMQGGRPLAGRQLLEAQAAWVRGFARSLSTTLELATSPKLVWDALVKRSVPTMEQLAGVDLALMACKVEYLEDPDWLPTRLAAVVDLVDEVLAAAAATDPGLLLNVHKQHASRPLEPFLWHTGIHTAHVAGEGSSWENLFAQRCTPPEGLLLAQPEFAAVADAARDAIDASVPTLIEFGDWHRPFHRPDDGDNQLSYALTLAVCTARAARVSYLSHDGIRDVGEDVRMYQQRLRAANPPHWAPFEHVTSPVGAGHASGRIPGWRSLRHDIEALAIVDRAVADYSTVVLAEAA